MASMISKSLKPTSPVTSGEETQRHFVYLSATSSSFLFWFSIFPLVRRISTALDCFTRTHFSKTYNMASLSDFVDLSPTSFLGT